ncbi:hypothetical protein PR202_gb23239 [Eleusine coracana subsp. coracana]|uniref:Uncharacterized protein n=1 Tax=Eleusine coracana subsp. coracana TaxID=191504 RepID=A0AAV5FIE4_ELECO|nr:hypothetical protein PR202_gb23239 [Eleusine coracana subsp. coracana]
MEEVISGRVGGCHLVYAPYICNLMRRLRIVIEEQYEAFLEVTTSYSPYVPRGSRSATSQQTEKQESLPSTHKQEAHPETTVSESASVRAPPQPAVSEAAHASEVAVIVRHLGDFL